MLTGHRHQTRLICLVGIFSGYLIGVVTVLRIAPSSIHSLSLRSWPTCRQRLKLEYLRKANIYPRQPSSARWRWRSLSLSWWPVKQVPDWSCCAGPQPTSLACRLSCSSSAPSRPRWQEAILRSCFSFASIASRCGALEQRVMKASVGRYFLRIEFDCRKAVREFGRSRKTTRSDTHSKWFSMI
jgi:hypothetical protein